MRIGWLAFTFALLAGCGQPEVYLCGSDSGQVTAQEKACTAPADPHENDNVEGAPASSVTLLSRLTVSTLQPTPTWLNWAFSDQTDALIVRASEGQTGYFISGNGFLYAVDLSTGKALWTHAGGDPITQVLVANDRILTVSAFDHRIRSHDRASGALVSVHEQPDTATDLLVAGDLLVFIDNYQDLVALDTRTLVERWRITPPSYELYTLQLYQNTLLLTDRHYVVHAYEVANGAQRWQQQLGDSGELTIGAGVFYQDRLGSQILTLDVKTGSTLATYHYDENANITLEPYGPMVFNYRETGGKLEAIDPLTGNVRWTSTALGHPGINALQINGTRLLAIDFDNSLLRIVDNQTGELTGTLHIPRMTFSVSRSEQNTLLYGWGTVLMLAR
jgi:outer membrane protein assembly factor BamB